MQAPATTAIKTYTIDPNHSTVRFWAKHLMISKVHGELPDVTGTVVANEEDPSQSKIDVQIKAHTLSTKNDQRDAHLRSADFLDTENFPDIMIKFIMITHNVEETMDIN